MLIVVGKLSETGSELLKTGKTVVVDEILLGIVRSVTTSLERPVVNSLTDLVVRSVTCPRGVPPEVVLVVSVINEVTVVSNASLGLTVGTALLVSVNSSLVNLVLSSGLSDEVVLSVDPGGIVWSVYSRVVDSKGTLVAGISDGIVVSGETAG